MKAGKMFLKKLRTKEFSTILTEPKMICKKCILKAWHVKRLKDTAPYRVLGAIFILRKDIGVGGWVVQKMAIFPYFM